MKVLKICTTYSCPFKCYFCFNKDKAEDNTLLPLEDVEKFLEKNSKKFDKIVITGGEPSLVLKSYITQLVELVKKYTSNVEMETYPIIENSFFDNFTDVKLNVSYDFTARSRVQEVWKQLLTFNRPFDIIVTLSPIVFRFSPNKIIQTLNMLPNLKHVTFKPFLNNKNYQYNIKQSDYQNFVDVLNGSKLNVHFTYSYTDFNDEFILTPHNKLCVVQFDKEIRYEKEISDNEIESHTTNYPNYVRV